MIFELSIIAERPFGRREECRVQCSAPDIRVEKLAERQELSNDAFSLMMASAQPMTAYAVRGYASRREMTMAARQELARRIATQIERQVLDYLGRNDRTNGYTRKEMEQLLDGPPQQRMPRG